jgi:hypothetical protein
MLMVFSLGLGGAHPGNRAVDIAWSPASGQIRDLQLAWGKRSIHAAVGSRLKKRQK